MILPEHAHATPSYIRPQTHKQRLSRQIAPSSCWKKLAPDLAGKRF